MLLGGNTGYDLYLSFCLAVTFSAWYASLETGVLAALLSALVLEQILHVPLTRLDISLEDFKLVGVFALISFLASWLNIVRRHTLKRGDRKRGAP